MKINNNLNNSEFNLKQQAQAIYQSIVKYNVLNDEKFLSQIKSEILNEANQGERELNIYLRKMPNGYRGCHGFATKVNVIDLDEYSTTTMEEVYNDLATWFQTQGFLPQDIHYTPPAIANEYEPIIATITVKW